MSREIKFRVLHPTRGLIKLSEATVKFDDDGTMRAFAYDNKGNESECKLLQFTGLKDYRGKDVYQGDVCQHPNGETFTVKWSDSDSGFKADYGAGIGFGLLAIQFTNKGMAEVIGNIHEDGE